MHPVDTGFREESQTEVSTLGFHSRRSSFIIESRQITAARSRRGGRGDRWQCGRTAEGRGTLWRNRGGF